MLIIGKNALRASTEPLVALSDQGRGGRRHEDEFMARQGRHLLPMLVMSFSSHLRCVVLSAVKYISG